jgi:hypothetical protein
MVGSTNGRGVDLSMYMGRLIATFDPRRLLMFAVKVLERYHANPILGKHVGTQKKIRGAKDDRVGKTYGKRAWGFVISSGRNRLWLDTAPTGSKYGSVNFPGTPRRGKDVRVMGI